MHGRNPKFRKVDDEMMKNYDRMKNLAFSRVILYTQPEKVVV